MPLVNLIINSRDREDPDQRPHNFTQEVKGFFDPPKRFYVESVQMYNSQYTVNSTNKKLYWKDSTGTLRTSTLTEGYYSAPQLAAHVTTVMNADNTGSGTYTVSYSTLTGKLTFSNSTSNFQLLFGTYRADYNATTILFGFAARDYTGASSYTAEDMPNLSSRYYTVRTNLIKGNTYSSKPFSPVIAVVPNDVGFGELISYKPSVIRWIDIHDNDFTKITVSVRDDKGNLALLNGHWSMNIVVEI